MGRWGEGSSKPSSVRIGGGYEVGYEEEIEHVGELERESGEVLVGMVLEEMKRAAGLGRACGY